MKIAYLISSYLPKVGGAEAFVHSLACRMSEKGHKVAVITPSRGGAGDSFFRYDVVRLNPLLNRMLFLNFGIGKRYLENVLRRLQKKYAFDIWHATIGYPLGAASADFFKKNRISCVLRCAGEDIQTLPEIGYGYRLNKKVDALARDNYRKFNALITAGEDMKSDYLSLGVPEENIHVIPNGVDCAKFRMDVDSERIKRELGLAGNEKLIITVGRNHAKKGYSIIPEVIKRLSEKKAEFKWLLVGRGCEGIQRLAEKEGVGSYLLVRNTVSAGLNRGGHEIPNRKLLEYYKASDVFVFPTLIELFAKVVIEAMAAGLPVVATDSPGVNNIVRDGENGIKNKIGDAEGIADSVFKLLSDGALAKRISQNALRDAENYDWSRISGMYAGLYEKLVKANGAD